MILKNLKAIPETDPADLIRMRDSVYATDLLITAIGCFDFFTWLNKNPSDFKSISSHFGLKNRPTDVMLTYFTAIDLITKVNGIFQTTTKADEFLTDGAEWSLVPYYLTQSERPIITKMYDVLKTNIPASWSAKHDESDWHKAMENENFAEIFSAGMDSRGAYFAPALAKKFDFSKYNSLLDIAGATGIYSACIKAIYPDIKTAVFEKTPVDSVAKISLSKRGLYEKIDVIGGDMFRNDLITGFDIHLYSHTFHDWGIEEIRQLVKKSYKSLNKNGIIMIHDAHINREKTGPLSVAEYSILLMFSTYGKCYSVGELEEILLSEGFSDVQYQPIIGNRSIITGKK